MTWETLRRLLFLLLVFCLVAVSAFSVDDPRGMTDQEILTELIALNEAKAIELEMREKIYNETEANLDMRENNLAKRETDLTEREASMIALGNFSQSLRKESERRRTSDYWRGFLHGSVVGFAGGSALGGFVGVKIGLQM